MSFPAAWAYGEGIWRCREGEFARIQEHPGGRRISDSRGRERRRAWIKMVRSTRLAARAVQDECGSPGVLASRRAENPASAFPHAFGCDRGHLAVRSGTPKVTLLGPWSRLSLHSDLQLKRPARFRRPHDHRARWAASFEQQHASYCRGGGATAPPGRCGDVLVLANNRGARDGARSRHHPDGAAYPCGRLGDRSYRIAPRADRCRDSWRRARRRDECRDPRGRRGGGLVLPPIRRRKSIAPSAAHCLQRRGMHGGKYGVTRDYVLGLRAICPPENGGVGDGDKEVFRCFNLRDLWIGSEGLLGVVTDAVLNADSTAQAALDPLTSFAG